MALGKLICFVQDQREGGNIQELEMALGDDVKVLGAWESPFVMRVRIALNLKGISYEFLPETIGAWSELLLESNPVYRKIPVLIHNGSPISESMVIVEYIDEVWSSGTSILPVDPYDRAVSRFWATYIDSKLIPLAKGLILASTVEAVAEGAERLSEGLLLLEEAFVKCSKGKEFFGGDNIGYVDIALGCMLTWLEAISKLSNVKFLEKKKMPLLAGWAERFVCNDAVRELMPEVEELVAFSKFVKAYYGALPRV